MLALVAVTLAACGRDEEEGGGGRPIRGSPTTRSRSAAAILQRTGVRVSLDRGGAQARFKFLNAKGGVDGPKIEFITLDDAYEPPRPSKTPAG